MRCARSTTPRPGMNIVDLGLVYYVSVTADAVHVEMTMTTRRVRWRK